MRIKYGRLIDTEAQLKDITTDLDGNVRITFDVKGSQAVITMKASEAASMNKTFTQLDVAALAKVYG